MCVPGQGSLQGIAAFTSWNLRKPQAEALKGNKNPPRVHALPHKRDKNGNDYADTTP